jgi:hypothetical protein
LRLCCRASGRLLEQGVIRGEHALLIEELGSASRIRRSDTLGAWWVIEQP